jgi:hypothetical protein
MKWNLMFAAKDYLFANFTILIHLYITEINLSHMLTFQSFTILFKDTTNLFFYLFLVVRILEFDYHLVMIHVHQFIFESFEMFVLKFTFYY